RQEGKLLRVKFFGDQPGQEPVRRWLKEELSAEQRKTVGHDIWTVERGWPMGMPTVRKIEEDLWEVRSKFRNGIARVFFTVSDDLMLLLHGIIKKSQKTPQRELDIARKRLRIARSRR